MTLTQKLIIMKSKLTKIPIFMFQGLSLPAGNLMFSEVDYFIRKNLTCLS